MIRMVALLVACVALSGCLSAQERLARDLETCKGYGFASDALLDCANELQQHRTEQALRIQNALLITGQALQNASAAINAANANQPRQIHCNNYGTYSTCTEY